MGLIANGYRNGFAPFKRYPGAATTIYNGHAIDSSYRAGRLRNIGLWTSTQIGLPAGNLHPECWTLPQKGGAMSMRAVGSGAASAALVPSRAMSIDFTGAGDFEAAAALVVSMAAALSGGGSLTATIQGRLNASIGLTGSGTLAASMAGFADMIVDMLGAGDLEATIAAYGNMEIDIVVTGAGLTTANVGQAVWSALAASNDATGTMGEKLNDAGSGSNPWTEVIEGGLTAAEILRILASVAAGRTTITDNGDGTATVEFVGLDDATTRVTAEMTGSDRTAMTLDGT